MDNRDIILGLDSGTSVVKAVAFDLEGEQIECASVRNSYSRSAGGAAQQSMEQTRRMPWCLSANLLNAWKIWLSVWLRLLSPGKATALAGGPPKPPGR